MLALARVFGVVWVVNLEPPKDAAHELKGIDRGKAAVVNIFLNFHLVMFVADPLVMFVQLVPDLYLMFVAACYVGLDQ